MYVMLLWKENTTIFFISKQTWKIVVPLLFHLFFPCCPFNKRTLCHYHIKRHLLCYENIIHHGQWLDAMTSSFSLNTNRPFPRNFPGTLPHFTTKENRNNFLHIYCYFDKTVHNTLFSSNCMVTLCFVNVSKKISEAVFSVSLDMSLIPTRQNH